MDPNQSLLEVGRVAKPHGLRGEVTVRLLTDRTKERAAPGAVLRARGKGGSASERELVVRSARPYQKGWLMMFEGVDTREAADELRGLVLFAAPLHHLDDDVVFVHELIGCRLIDQHGVDHGEILSVIDNPAADLLELADDVLVPLNFLVEIVGDRVIVEVPDGLLHDGGIEAVDSSVDQG